MNQFTFDPVKQSQAWLVPGWVIVEDSDHKFGFLAQPCLLRLMWVSGRKSNEWRVTPPSWYKLDMYLKAT